MHLEPDLAYRYACRVGMCGSCAMMVNGVPRWTCRTHVDKIIPSTGNNQLLIEPLRNMVVVKDLACDMQPFFDRWERSMARFFPTSTRHESVERISPRDKKRAEADWAIECINCGICYAACDVVASKADYLGPAALNRAWSLHNDIRDGAKSARIDRVSGADGCGNCHSQQGCSQWCPNGLNPTRSIAGLKRASLVKMFGLDP